VTGPAAIERLARSLTYPTVASRIGEEDTRRAYSELLDFVTDAYPALFSVATVHREDPWQLVIELAGEDRSLDPLLVLAHYDVVDVEPGTEADWSHEPFGGAVDDGYVWGRGALDDKNSFIATLEAAEQIVSTGGKLQRGLVLAFGGDEEIAGRRGAARIAGRFREAGRRFHAVLDEGAVIAVGALAQPTIPIALIGVAEKGHVDVVIRAESEGGHAAMPPAHSAVGRIAEAVTRVEAHPFRPRLIAPVREFFRSLAPHASGPLRVVYAHPVLFWPLLRSVLGAGTSTSALIRTTQAVTMARGSAAPNVLPGAAEAVVNVRILPGESVKSVLEHYRTLLARLPVTVALRDPDDAHDPVATSATDHPFYAAIRDAATARFDCVAAPYLVTGSTDSKWYADLGDAVFRFVGMALDGEEIGRIHGTDERVSLDNFERLVRFYEDVITRECIDG
jgi:carboxypeptidase PM20D1